MEEVGGSGSVGPTHDLGLQHGQLVLVQWPLPDRQELPAEERRQLLPGQARRVQKQRQVLATQSRTSARSGPAEAGPGPGSVLTSESAPDAILDHMMEAQALGTWLELETTTSGRELAWWTNRTGPGRQPVQNRVTGLTGFTGHLDVEGLPVVLQLCDEADDVKLLCDGQLVLIGPKRSSI